MSRRQTSDQASAGASAPPAQVPAPPVTAPGPEGAQLLGQLPGAQAADLLHRVGASQGNSQAQRMVQRYTPAYGEAPPPAPSFDPDADQGPGLRSQEDLGETVMLIHDSVAPGNVRDPGQIPLLLKHRSRSSLAAIATLFASTYGDSLHDYVVGHCWSYSKDNEDVEAAVDALALLADGHTNGLHTAVARALIPDATRDTELFRILKAVSAAYGGTDLKNDYERVFSPIGSGTLQGDLEGDLSGDDQKRALAMIHHPFTEAEELYLAPNSDAALALLQATWAKGPAAFSQLSHDWDAYVVGMNSWTSAYMRDYFVGQKVSEDNPFAMMQALPKGGPLRGAHVNIARAIFDGYDRYFEKAGAIEARYGEGLDKAFLTFMGVKPADAPPAGGVPAGMGTEQFLLDDLRLQTDIAVAKEAMAAATETEDVTQIRKYAEMLGGLHQKRMALAEKTYDEKFIEEVKWAWKADKASLLSGLGAEIGYTEGGEIDTTDLKFGAGADEYARTRLLLEGNLGWADKLWIAEQDGDRTKTVEVLSRAWAANQMPKLIEEAKFSRIDDSGTVIRPNFDPKTVANQWVGSEDEQRVASLFSSSTRIGQGVARVKMELEAGTGDPQLKKAFDFLSLEGVTPDLQQQVIFHYATFHVGDAELQAAKEHIAGPAANVDQIRAEVAAYRGVDRFIEHILYRYSASRTYYDFLDMLQPATTLDTIVGRAEGRVRAETGTVDEMAAYFDMSGEDSLQVAQSSLERLQWIRDQAASPAELTGLMRLLGAATPLDLGKVEYGLLKERLADVKAFRESFAEIVSKIVEVAVTAALTFATAGAGSIIIAAVASSYAMGTKKLILGDDYELVTVANGVELAKGLLTELAGGKVGKYFDAATPFGIHIKKLGAPGEFMKETAVAGTKQIVGSAVTATHKWQLPSSYDVMGSLAQSAWAGAGAYTKIAPTTEGKIDAWLAKTKESAISGIGSETIDELVGLGNTGISGKSDSDILLGFGLRGVKTVAKSAMDAPLELYVEGHGEEPTPAEKAIAAEEEKK